MEEKIIKRENGYYWVKYGDSEWEVADFQNGKWFYLYGGYDSYDESDFTEINELRILSPDE